MNKFAKPKIEEPELEPGWFIKDVRKAYERVKEWNRIDAERNQTLDLKYHATSKLKARGR